VSSSALLTRFSRNAQVPDLHPLLEELGGCTAEEALPKLERKSLAQLDAMLDALYLEVPCLDCRATGPTA